ncbi:MAG: inositol monophosphatase [Planctomycetes bacterium]|nr:inositol monophosphatase [Planctomycetota bacterium]
MISRRGSEDTAALDFAVQIAREAGRVLLQHFERLDPTRIERKSTHRDLVTAADLASERTILQAVRARYPGHAIHAEEEGRSGSPDAPTWIVDPLDGTINFVHGLPAFGVSIALYEGGEPRVGVVHLPKLGETFSARAGGGAFLAGRPIRVARTSELKDALVATGFPYERGDPERDNAALFAHLYPQVRDLRRWGAASADLAFVACGRFDAFWELDLKPYDVAAGALLVREAGGVVTDLRGGNEWLHGGSVVCGPPVLHAALQRELRGRWRGGA